MRTLVCLSLILGLSACGDSHQMKALETENALIRAELEIAKLKVELAEAKAKAARALTTDFKPSERTISEAELVYRLKSLKVHKDILNSMDTSKLDAHMRFQREQQLRELRKLEDDIKELRK